MCFTISLGFYFCNNNHYITDCTLWCVFLKPIIFLMLAAITVSVAPISEVQHDPSVSIYISLCLSPLLVSVTLGGLRSVRTTYVIGISIIFYLSRQLKEQRVQMTLSMLSTEMHEACANHSSCSYTCSRFYCITFLKVE